MFKKIEDLLDRAVIWFVRKFQLHVGSEWFDFGEDE